MKYAFQVLLICIFCIVSHSFTLCAQDKPATSGSKSKTKTIQLTKDAFLTKVVNYKKDTTEWKYLGNKPCLIDFYADWCGPCKKIAPILEELATEYDGQIYVYKINTDIEKELSGIFGIRSIPTLLFIPMKGAPSMAQGALPKNDLKQAIEEVLLAKGNKPAN